MKKINWKILNTAFWIELVLCYLLPFKVVSGFQYEVGFPIPFITVYNMNLRINPFMSMRLNPLGLMFNGIIIYFIISICVKVYQNYKNR